MGVHARVLFICLFILCLLLFRLEKESQEAERLHNLTEDEWRNEVRNNPKQITNKAAKGKYRFLQKYYHRGAFFLVSASSCSVVNSHYYGIALLCQ